MVEMRFQGQRAYRASLEPGIYSLTLPEPADLTAELEKLAGPQTGSLCCSALEERKNVVWLPEAGGLISNLRVWENVVLPRWYHAGRLDDALEQETLAWIRRLLPYIAEPEVWLHRTVGQLEESDRCLAGLIRALLAPAAGIVIEADWASRLEAAQFQLCCSALLEHAQTRGRVVLVFGGDAQALNAMLLWQPYTQLLNWTVA